MNTKGAGLVKIFLQFDCNFQTSTTIGSKLGHFTKIRMLERVHKIVHKSLPSKISRHLNLLGKKSMNYQFWDTKGTRFIDIFTI